VTTTAQWQRRRKEAPVWQLDPSERSGSPVSEEADHADLPTA